jgi:Flp pilus assembly protein CpaB
MDQLLRFMLRHRRLLAATAAGLGVFFALTALTKQPVGHPVVVADHDLTSGTTLRLSDVRTVTMPSSLVPDGAVRRPAEVVGRTTSGAMRRGEVLTDRQTIRAGRLTGYGRDRVLSVVRVTDAGVLALLRPGDAVDVVAVTGDDKPQARRVARRAPVVTLPKQRSTFSEGAPVGLAVTPAVALELAERALDSRLSVVVAQSP